MDLMNCSVCGLLCNTGIHQPQVGARRPICVNCFGLVGQAYMMERDKERQADQQSENGSHLMTRTATSEEAEALVGP